MDGDPRNGISSSRLWAALSAERRTRRGREDRTERETESGRAGRSWGPLKNGLCAFCQSRNLVAHGGERAHQFFRRDHNPRDCAACDVTGSEQDAGAFVPFCGYASANRRLTCAAQLGACAKIELHRLDPSADSTLFSALVGRSEDLAAY